MQHDDVIRIGEPNGDVLYILNFRGRMGDVANLGTLGGRGRWGPLPFEKL